MASIAALKQKALSLVAAQTDEELVKLFALTDTEIDAAKTAEQRQHVVQVRGWLMDELESRGKLDLVMGTL